MEKYLEMSLIIIIALGPVVLPGSFGCLKDILKLSLQSSSFVKFHGVFKRVN